MVNVSRLLSPRRVVVETLETKRPCAIEVSSVVHAEKFGETSRHVDVAFSFVDTPEIAAKIVPFRVSSCRTECLGRSFPPSEKRTRIILSKSWTAPRGAEIGFAIGSDVFRWFSPEMCCELQILTWREKAGLWLADFYANLYLCEQDCETSLNLLGIFKNVKSL